jgi:SpoU rRNA methylase family enzyme
MAAPVKVDGVSGIAAFFRIRDTVENRDSLRAALAEFHGKRLLTLPELDEGIEVLRQRIKENVVPKLR